MTNSTALATAADVSKMVTDAATTQGAQAQKMLEDGAVKASHCSRFICVNSQATTRLAIRLM